VALLTNVPPLGTGGGGSGITIGTAPGMFGTGAGRAARPTDGCVLPGDVELGDAIAPGAAGAGPAPGGAAIDPGAPMPIPGGVTTPGGPCGAIGDGATAIPCGVAEKRGGGPGGGVGLGCPGAV
jgi:hypothetical protein